MSIFLHILKVSQRKIQISLTLTCLLLSACSQPAPPATQINQPVPSEAIPTQLLESASTTQPSVTPPDPTAQASQTPSNTPPPSLTPEPTSTPTPDYSPTPDLRPLPDRWREWPVVPSVSWKTGQIYLTGLALGNNPHAYTKIGDCQSTPDVFLGIYDTNRYWFTEDYKFLQETVDYFKGFFSQESVAARDGFGVASPLSPLTADPDYCQANETPLECEFRLKRPSIAFIAMGTNWAPNASASFEKYMRQIVEISIEQGVIPVLVTKADNIEQDSLLNQVIAQVAYDYDVPLFNAWRAVQFLPNHGLKEDGVYLTTEAWDVRSFAALETLDALRRALQELSSTLTN